MIHATVFILPVGLFAALHWLLGAIWACRNDGQAGMCCCPIGCGAVVLTPLLLFALSRIRPTGAIEANARIVALFLGATVSVHMGVILVRLANADRRG